MAERRYVAGCAGQFVLGMGLAEFDDEHEAIVYAGTQGPLGCEVFDRQSREWIGPCGPEDVEHAMARVTAREEGQPHAQ